MDQEGGEHLISDIGHLSNTGLSLINKGVSLIILTIGSQIQDRIGFSKYPDPFLFSKNFVLSCLFTPTLLFQWLSLCKHSFLVSLSSLADLLQITITAITGEMHAKKLEAI